MKPADYIPPAWDAEMHPVQIAGFRKMSVARKWELMSQMYHAAIAMKTTQFRGKHPEWSAAELDRAARRAMLHAGT